MRWVGLVLAIVLAGCAGRAERVPTASAPQRVITVNSDPDNLPFSNLAGEGFENKIVELIAAELNAKVDYIWRSQQTGLFRPYKNEKIGELTLGVPAGAAKGLSTTSYYRSSYVFVTRTSRRLDVRSFDDPRLKTLKIGVQMVGSNFADTPPIHALARRGITDNVVRIRATDTGRSPDNAIAAVANGEVDLAIVWGPSAGWLVRKGLSITLPDEQIDPPGLPLAFDIAMGIARENPQLRDEINRVLADKRVEINRILDTYHVPRVQAPVVAVSTR
jgi:mxaJ protein